MPGGGQPPPAPSPRGIDTGCGPGQGWPPAAITSVTRSALDAAREQPVTLTAGEGAETRHARHTGDDPDQGLLGGRLPQQKSKPHGGCVFGNAATTGGLLREGLSTC